MRSSKFSIVVLVFLVIACGRNQDENGTSIFERNMTAQWIQDGRPLPDSDSLFYLDQPDPLFRKEFKAANTIKNAKLFITAAGYYKASVNGNSVGENVLDPAWTDFSKRIYYAEYDVTPLINEGDNCLGVSLGNGFYNPLPLGIGGHRN